MTATNITIQGGVTVQGGVALRAAPYILQITRDQMVDWAGPEIPTLDGFIQPGDAGGAVILVDLTPEQTAYLTSKVEVTYPGNYVLFDGSWGVGSTDTAPNTGVVFLPVQPDWDVALLLPLGSQNFNGHSVYPGTWNFPFTATTFVDAG